MFQRIIQLCTALPPPPRPLALGTSPRRATSTVARWPRSCDRRPAGGRWFGRSPAANLRSLWGRETRPRPKPRHKCTSGHHPSPRWRGRCDQTWHWNPKICCSSSHKPDGNPNHWLPRNSSLSESSQWLSHHLGYKVLRLFQIDSRLVSQHLTWPLPRAHVPFPKFFSRQRWFDQADVQGRTRIHWRKLKPAANFESLGSEASHVT